jgi:predicted phosphodiesterase
MKQFIATNFYKRLLFSLILFIFISTVSQSKILMKPYLQDVTPTSVYVMVECSTKDPVKIKYKQIGTDKEEFAQTKIFKTIKYRLGIHVHQIYLENLSAGTRYKYWAIQEKETVAGGEFITAPLPNTPLRFAVIGDNRSNPKVFNKITSLASKEKPDLLIMTGDLCFDGSYEAWHNQFFTDSNLDLITSVPFYNAIGNHEDMTDLVKSFLKAPSSPDKDNFFYSFDYGDIHFLILNTEESCRKGSLQYNFAFNDLKATIKPWKIVAFHKPAYCAGGHGENEEMVKVTKEIFEPNKVDIVLNGHTHFYQRNYVNKIYHLILAGGGAPLYSPGKDDYVQKTSKSYNYAIFDYKPGELKMQVYDEKHNILDTLELKK